jgi:GMP synthase (glutamine-hydrolysing)
VLIQSAIKKDVYVFGFCLGAQLVGAAYGATTERSPNKEIGVYPVTFTEDGCKDPLLEGLPQPLPVIHWHNDMPGLTAESTLLAYSDGCPRQMVRYAPTVYGFQCHLEIAIEGIRKLIASIYEDPIIGAFCAKS